jgi:cytochrome c556
MIKTIVLPGLAALGLAICLIAQTEADYPGLMKDVGATKGKITKGIAAKQNDGVATDAAHLADVFKKVGAFWTSRDASDAVNLAKTGETAANDLAAAAKAGDEAKMQSSLQAINSTCGSCHMAHREGSPGSFKIK